MVPADARASTITGIDEAPVRVSTENATATKDAIRRTPKTDHPGRRPGWVIRQIANRSADPLERSRSPTLNSLTPDHGGDREEDEHERKHLDALARQDPEVGDAREPEHEDARVRDGE